MEKKMNIAENRILTLSNDIAEYPPTNLTIYEWQGLIVLSAIVNGKEKPIYSIEDIRQEAEKRGLVTPEEQNALLRELVEKQKTYEMSFDEFFGYYDGDIPLTRKTKHDILKALVSLNKKSIVTANEDEDLASFSWFDWIRVRKKEKTINYSLGSASQSLLMGLKSNFLQLLAHLSIKKAKKYDIPIFLHMKSKLHHGRKAYKNKENLLEFQKRFGHDKVSSYVSSWKDYYRRVLKPAEEYSKRSNDIEYKFRGIATKGRKITEVEYTIRRIGNIHVPKELEAQKNSRNEWNQIEKSLSPSQHKGYLFLKAKGVNYAFLLDDVMQHKCLAQEVIVNYEDLFLELLWKRFYRYTKATKKAGAFVSWWRTGKLTDEGEHYWAIIDELSKQKTQLEKKAISERQVAKKATKTEKPGAAKNDKGFVGVNNIVKKTKPSFTALPFDYITFKKSYKQEHDKIAENIFERLADVLSTSKGGGADVDMNKVRDLEKQVKQMLPQHCELWYKENVLKVAS